MRTDVPVRLGRDGTELVRRPEAFESFREEFDRNHAVRLREFLAPDLLAFLQERLEVEAFETTSYPGVGTEMRQASGVAAQALLFVMNDPALLDAVSRLSGCENVGSFAGRIYRLKHEAWQLDAWHDDDVEGRLLALSINLSARPFDGGVLEMREAASKRVHGRFDNTVPGDALLFRIGPMLEHRVTTVTGPNPKTSFAGWFYPGPRVLVASGAPRLDAP